MKKHQKRKLIDSDNNLLVFVVVILALAIASAATVWGLKRNRTTHAQDEIRSISTVQVKLLKLEIEDQYGPLNTLATYMETNKVKFGDKELEAIAEVVKSVHRLCTIGYADQNGDAVNYQGEDMGGNISDRPYFSEVINGNCENYCMYLATTKALNEPRVLFSVPVYENGEITGVIFASKEINILENALFLEAFFDETVNSFIADPQGNLIAFNHRGEEETLQKKLCAAYGIVQEDGSIEELIQLILSEHIGEWYSAAREREYISCTPIGLNDWYLFNVVDERTLMQQYKQSEQALINLVIILFTVLLLTIVFIIVVLSKRQKRTEIEVESFRNQHESYRALLYEMNSTIVEYDLQKDLILPNRIFASMLDGEEPFTFDKLTELLRQRHPEFNITDLITQKDTAIRECRSTLLESIFILDDDEIRWFKIVLLPIQNMQGKVTKIYAAVMDTTEYHKEFEEAVQFMEHVPGGMHRCYLSTPIHLEYVSDGLGKMLGYSDIEEFRALIGDKYSLVIAEEDRTIFRDFVRELAEKEDSMTCEYRMICKDGSLITVSDTMESRKNADGIMYGYSAVTNLEEYKKQQKAIESELAQTKAQLMEARIKNANSQMQPHFLYNALASIREIVLEDPEYASNLIFDFSTHLRACIRSMSNDNLISFSQELENIKAYINIEQMRFGSKLKVVYDIEADQFEIIPLGLQPLVENAVRHGIYERGRVGGTVYIKTYAEDDNWVIQIADDGVGFDVQDIFRQIEDGSRDSTGMQNLLLRFEKQMQAKVDIRSEVGVGTKVTIYIPKGANDESNNC